MRQQIAQPLSRLVVLAALLLPGSSCSSGPPPPALDVGFRELAQILDATIKDAQIEVTRTEDLRSPECTTNIGWTNTGKYKQSRHVEGALPSPADLRAQVQKIGARWQSEKFTVRFFETRDGGMISVTAQDDRRGDLFFSGFTNRNQVSLSAETICLKP